MDTDFLAAKEFILWGGAVGNGAGKSRATGARGAGASAVEGGGIGGTAQGRPGEGEIDGPVTGGNDGDDEMDRRAIADGQLDASQSSVILAPAKKTMNCKYYNTRTRFRV